MPQGVQQQMVLKIRGPFDTRHLSYSLLILSELVFHRFWQMFPCYDRKSQAMPWLNSAKKSSMIPFQLDDCTCKYHHPKYRHFPARKESPGLVYRVSGIRLEERLNNLYD